MSATVLLFAAAREAAGGSRQETVAAATVAEALQELIERHGSRFERIARISTVLHHDAPVAHDAATALADGDTIAILPPVSGGQDITMVDVGDKEESVREATAVCTLHGDAAVIARLLAGETKKGDAVASAKVAGILAAKRTPELIPLCHPVRTTSVKVQIDADGDGAIAVRATVRGRDRTGFEIEALVACSTAALTLYDMAKAEDPMMRVEGLRIVAKSGGKSGSVTYP